MTSKQDQYDEKAEKYFMETPRKSSGAGMVKFLAAFGRACAREAFDLVLAQKVGPCYSSGLPCGCKDDAVKAAKAQSLGQGGGE